MAIEMSDAEWGSGPEFGDMLCIRAAYKTMVLSGQTYLMPPISTGPYSTTSEASRTRAFSGSVFIAMRRIDPVFGSIAISTWYAATFLKTCGWPSIEGMQQKLHR